MIITQCYIFGISVEPNIMASLVVVSAMQPSEIVLLLSSRLEFDFSSFSKLTTFKYAMFWKLCRPMLDTIFELYLSKLETSIWA